MSDTIRCLSLHQPWASLMACGAKKVETRSWQTPYRGWLAIHAAKNRDSLEIVDSTLFAAALINAGYPTYRRYDESWVTKRDLEFGAIIAVGNLHKVGRIFERRGESYVSGQELPYKGDELEFGDWTPGRFGWVVTNVQRLPNPIPYRGQQGIWTLETEIVDQIRAQQEATS